MQTTTLLRTTLYILTASLFSPVYADNINSAINPAILTSAVAPVVNLPSGQYVSLCFHDIRDDVKAAVDNDQYAISTKRLAELFDWIRVHDWHPISVQQIIDAKAGKAPLPNNAILLSFDDGLRSIYTKAFPLLQAYQYPALFALETGWLTQVNQAQVVQYHGERFNPNQAAPTTTTVIYNEEPRDQSGFVTWAQLQEMQASGLVEFASHTHNLHRGILANPQGNVEPAAITRTYLPELKRYETDTEFHTRVRDDLRLSSQTIKEKIGVVPRAIVWPYGAMTPEVEKIAKELGLTVSLGLSDKQLNQQNQDLSTIGRLLISNNPNPITIENQIAQSVIPPKQIERAVQVDIDYLYDPNSTEQTNINLGKLLDRIKALHVSTVYLQAFSDPEGTGNASELYFPNSVLPMRADLFNRVAWQLSTRANVRVFAWLPLLAYQLPNQTQQQRLSVKIKNAQGQLIAVRRDYQRLSPFLPESAKIIGDIYADLAKNMSGLDGVLIHDDAYLAEDEDQSIYESTARWPGTQRGLPETDLTPRQKTEALMAFGDVVIGRMKPHINTSNPFSVARNLYARVVLDPTAESRFAQALEPFVTHYDYVALMAMPYLDGTTLPSTQWLSQLADTVKRSPNPDTMKKVVFELQARNWQDKTWIPATTMKSWMQLLTNKGVSNLAYYPDDYLGNHPTFQPVYEGLSLSAFPHYGEHN
ncbi:MAG: poly-beta-1,6-N-acetyl-D-glucosamine N-deacetylase PgaB [Sulfuriferula sp.]|nr:poly-beta-1,6-N-acetyl-D-glucosamine N-deacetylase PgaB [Sulfuriferula sp.]